VLSVDDDLSFQRSIAFALEGARILQRPIELVQAFSMAEAANLLSRERDFAVVLVDVVMETEDAGLRLIKAVREVLGLAELRFIILTGQPGMAPVDTVMQDYDLSDYCLKTDLATRGLKNILSRAIRTYQKLSLITSARRGLQRIVESSNRLTGKRSLHEIASVTLDEIAVLLHVPAHGMVYACSDQPEQNDGGPETAATQVTIAASGRFKPYADMTLAQLPQTHIQELITRAFQEQRAIETDEAQVLYFSREESVAEFAIYVATGRPLDDTERELLHVFSANASKSFANVALFSRLDRLAYEDELLHIPNRSAILREIERLRIQRNAPPSTLVMLDLDNFSGLNHLFGVHFGNQALQNIANRLQGAFPQPSMVARLYSDTFAILGESAQVNVDSVKQVFTTPFNVGQTCYLLSACYTEIPLTHATDTAAELLRAACGGLQSARQRGPGSTGAYDPAFQHLAAERFELLHRLAEGIQRDELALVYQPQVDLSNGAITGIEALLRWHSPAGLVLPGSFIPLAEQSVYIHAIGDMVAAQACAAVRALDAVGLGNTTVGLNYSARQFEAPDVIERLHEACVAAGITPARLCIEVTETVMMHSFQRVAAALRQHQDCGGTVAIDDFGTGMSSLEYLLELPVDCLKIDKTFVHGVDGDERSQALTRMIIELSQRLHIGVVAEGVETEAQAMWLRENGPRVGQGWYLGRPQPLPELISWID
jgi:diguanylate cyclase (GGDEF)-like protein